MKLFSRQNVCITIPVLVLIPIKYIFLWFIATIYDYLSMLNSQNITVQNSRARTHMNIDVSDLLNGNNFHGITRTWHEQWGYLSVQFSLYMIA